jgi:hypothetical protein
MSAVFLLWVGLGLLAGELHMHALWGQVHHRAHLSWARLPLTVGFFLLAALLHGLWGAAVGWAVGALLAVLTRTLLPRRAS